MIPQGYRRINGAVIEDPEVAPVIRQIFELYGSGRFSFQTLADHLNSLGIRPKRGPGKTKHNRPAAVIFTGDVLKDLFDNPSYIGKLRVDGQLIEAKHPALIDEATWNRCLEVRRRNRRNTSKTWTRHSYPLTPVLRCGRCGSTMHGEVASDASGSRRYYACHAARRQRAATRLPLARCDARAIRSERIEEAIRQELGRCLPSDDVQAAYRAELERAIETPPHPRDVREARLRRLDEQLARVRQLYEYGEYDWNAFLAKRAEIHDAQQSLRDEASVTPHDGDLEWCRAQLLDLAPAWDAADDGQRSRLLSALFESVDAEALPQRGLRLVATPRGAWRQFFQSLVLEMLLCHVDSGRGSTWKISRAM